VTNLNILSGGAAQGLVASLKAQFRQQTGLDISGEFGAVGEGLVAGNTTKDVGRVETALAVREAASLVSAPDAAGLRAALLAADAIFVPDTKASTAGIHVAKVLQQLGIADEVAGRLKIYPNGATAMRHMADSNARKPIGCTQATEIIATAGVKLSGALPKGCDLATVYTAAITTKAAHAGEAQLLIDLLTSAEQRHLRQRAGFLQN
jgi:molybdate transport system substrate-binding protein